VLCPQHLGKHLHAVEVEITVRTNTSKEKPRSVDELIACLTVASLMEIKQTSTAPNNFY
jgi:hypothetical protein